MFPWNIGTLHIPEHFISGIGQPRYGEEKKEGGRGIRIGLPEEPI